MDSVPVRFRGTVVRIDDCTDLIWVESIDYDLINMKEWMDYMG